MKKNVKMTLVASTAALALAGSLMSCKQPVAPTTPENTKYEIPEMNLEVSKMSGKSKFGRNEVRFDFVNYADKNSYELYRFYENEIVGVPMYSTDTSVAALVASLGSVISSPNFDGIVVIDQVSESNPMLPGRYTYKLIAKAAKTLTPNGQTTRAVQKVSPKDIYFIPSIAECVITVPDANMPKPHSKLKLEVADLKDKYQVDGRDLYIYPELDDNLAVYDDYDSYELEARLANISGDFTFDGSDSTVFVSSGDNKTNKIVKLTLPSTKSGKYDIWATRKYKNEYYADSDKIKIDTITLDPIEKITDGKVTVSQYDTLNMSNVLTWTLPIKFNNYKVEVQRAEKMTYEYAKQPSNNGEVNYYTEVVTLKDTDFVIAENKKILDADGKTVTEIKYTGTDKTAKEGHTYRYFLTFKDASSNNRVIDYAEEEITVKSKTANTITTYLTISDETAKQLNPVVKDAATNYEWASYTNTFTLKVVPTVGSDGKYTDIQKDIFEKLTYKVSRVGTGVNYNEVVPVPDSAITLVPGANGEKLISISETLPFKEDTKVTKYSYWFTFSDGVNTYEPYNIATSDVEPLSKKRYEFNKISEKSFEATQNTAKAEVYLSAKAIEDYKTRYDINTVTAANGYKYDVIPRPNLNSIPLSEFVIKYDLKCENNDSYSLYGQTVTYNAEKEKTLVNCVTIDLKNLVPGYKYVLTCKVYNKDGKTYAGGTEDDYVKTFATKMVDLNAAKYSAVLSDSQIVLPSISATLKEDAVNFGTSVCSYTGSVNVTGGKLNEYELVKVYRVAKNPKATYNDVDLTPVDRVTEWNSKFQVSDTSVYIDDNALPFDNIAESFAYKFILYNVKNPGYAVFETKPITAKKYIRYELGAKVSAVNPAEGTAEAATEVSVTVTPTILRNYSDVKLTAKTYEVAMKPGTLSINGANTVDLNADKMNNAKVGVVTDLDNGLIKIQGFKLPAAGQSKVEKFALTVNKKPYELEVTLKAKK